jgi:excisionase family DNA binding protein
MHHLMHPPFAIFLASGRDVSECDAKARSPKGGWAFLLPVNNREQENRMKPCLSPNDRMLKLLQATPEVLSGIDALLENREPPTPTTSGPLLFGMDAGAKFLGVSRSTLWRLVKSGRITPVEFRPGSYKVRRADLEQLARAGL